MHRFNAPAVDQKFELVGILANVFIVTPESLPTLFEGNNIKAQEQQSRCQEFNNIACKDHDI